METPCLSPFESSINQNYHEVHKINKQNSRTGTADEEKKFKPTQTQKAKIVCGPLRDIQEASTEEQHHF